MKQEIEMKAGDAAILLHANGDIGLLIPRLVDDDEDAPEHVQLAMAFGVVARNPVLRQMLQMMADSAMEEDAQDGRPEVTQ